MRRILYRLAGIFWLLLTMPALALADGSSASAGGIQLDSAWVRAVPPVSRNSVAFVHIRNTGKHDDFLLGVDSPIAATAELHDMVMDGNVMRMDKMAKARIPAGGELVLDPDSKHIMLFGLKAPLKIGQTVPLTLHFSRAGALVVQAKVVAQ